MTDSSSVYRTKQDESEVSQEEAVALVAVVAEDEGLTGVPFDMQHVSIILEGQGDGHMLRVKRNSCQPLIFSNHCHQSHSFLLGHLRLVLVKNPKLTFFLV
ncbi:unnamed protein product [Gadus morhua 'NCC']